MPTTELFDAKREGPAYRPRVQHPAIACTLWPEAHNSAPRPSPSAMHCGGLSAQYTSRLPSFYNVKTSHLSDRDHLEGCMPDAVQLLAQPPTGGVDGLVPLVGQQHSGGGELLGLRQRGGVAPLLTKMGREGG